MQKEQKNIIKASIDRLKDEIKSCKRELELRKSILIQMQKKLKQIKTKYDKLK